MDNSKIRWIELTSISDSRGCLTAAEVENEIPFELKRVFIVHNVLQNRGGHAHLDTDQILIAVSGNLTVETYDGNVKSKFLLSKPSKALYVPRMVFIDLLNFSHDGVCLALANTVYDIEKSIRSLKEFEKVVL